LFSVPIEGSIAGVEIEVMLRMKRASRYTTRIRHHGKTGNDGLGMQWKLPVLLLLYPDAAWRW
jgi:hypothetical protein